MKLRFSLYFQTLAMLILYLGTLLTITFFLFNAQFGLGWEAALKSPLGERFETTAGAVSSQLHASKPGSWNEILKSFGEIYHAQFYIFDFRRTQLAGQPIDIPSAVIDRLGPPPPMMPSHSPLGDGPDLRQPGPPEPPDNFGYGPGDPHQFHHHFFGGPKPPLGNGPDHHFAMPEPPASVFLHSTGRFMVHTKNPDRFWIGARIFVFSPGIGHAVPGILLASCDNLLRTNLLFDFQFVSLLFASVIGFSILFWWPFIFRITSALSRLTQATESIAQGKFDTRIKANGADEIGRLAEAVDIMAERLQGYVLAQRRLLADISHELFSPIARLQLALELLEENASESQSSQIADIREEVQEMNNLVSELIAYSKAGMQAKAPDPSAINLKALFDGLLPKITDGSTVKLAVPADLTVSGDRLLLERSISNVIRNSIRYAANQGPIEVSALQIGDEVILTMSDNGPGVSEEALKHLGEPFYRPEASRNRSSGGFGLGLAIVKSCVEACQGRLEVGNKKPNGLEVKIFLKTG
ncbi:MAG: HAMP domain-containing histidine kinase [Cyanobacteria bacterium REEB67]|nr:HAMP domain-containing histidine kinase [Cyanobacteria bacterium REEB67]